VNSDIIDFASLAPAYPELLMAAGALVLLLVGIIVNKEGEYEFARYPDGTLRWAVRNTSPGWAYQNTGVVAPLGQWLHVAFVYGGGFHALVHQRSPREHPIGHRNHR